MDLDAFFSGYLVAALWSSVDDDGEPMDATYSSDDLAPDALEALREDCADFVSTNAELLQRSGLSAGSAGHDFWLTRNGHGAGFWDRGLGVVGNELTTAAKVYGTVDLYIGDDGKVHA